MFNTQLTFFSHIQNSTKLIYFLPYYFLRIHLTIMLYIILFRLKHSSKTKSIRCSHNFYKLNMAYTWYYVWFF